MFEKYKLVRIDQADSEQQQHLDMRQLEKDLRNYDPTMRAIANHYGGIQDALLSTKKRKNLSPQTRLNLVAANRARMERLIRARGEATLTDALAGMQTREQAAPPEPASQKQTVEDAKVGAEDDYEAKPVTGQSNLAIPVRHSAKFTKLMKFASDTIGSNRHGELVIRGKKLDNTSYSDVMRALYVDSNFTVPGLDQTVAELKTLGVEPTLFTSRRARQLYSTAQPNKKTSMPQQKGSGRGEFVNRKRMLRVY